jgi:hypothetical protein
MFVKYVFGSAAPQIDFEWIDSINMILAKSELNV